MLYCTIRSPSLLSDLFRSVTCLVGYWHLFMNTVLYIPFVVIWMACMLRDLIWKTGMILNTTLCIAHERCLYRGYCLITYGAPFYFLLSSSALLRSSSRLYDSYEQRISCRGHSTNLWSFKAIDDFLTRYMWISSMIGMNLGFAIQARAKPRTPNQVHRVVRFLKWEIR